MIPKSGHRFSDQIMRKQALLPAGYAHLSRPGLSGGGQPC